MKENQTKTVKLKQEINNNINNNGNKKRSIKYTMHNGFIQLKGAYQKKMTNSLSFTVAQMGARDK